MEETAKPKAREEGDKGYNSFTKRKPRLLLRLSGDILLRFADLHDLALLIQLPPL